MSILSRILPAREANDAPTTTPDAGLSFGSALLPSLMLVPASRRLELARRRVKRMAFMSLSALGVIAVIAVGGLYMSLVAAQSSERTALAQMRDVEEQVIALQPVRSLYDGFETRQNAVANALASDVDYYRLITTLEQAIRAEIPLAALAQDPTGQMYVKSDWSHIGLTAFTVQNTPCPSSDVFANEPALGCISGTAVSSSFAKTGEIIRALNDDPSNGMFGGYVLNVSEQSPNGSVGYVSWTFTINFGAGALSGKYLEETAAILGGSAPSPSDSDNVDDSEEALS